MMRPPLRPLHSDDLLSPAKLMIFGRWDTDALRASLVPGQEHSLKVSEDGLMMDGHHRILVLRLRDVEVDALPRELWKAAGA